MKVRKKDKTETKPTEDPKRQKVELKGPRVKHVCRSASIVLGQPIATFPTQEEKEKQDKLEGEVALPDKDKDIDLPIEPEVDTENKAPQIIIEPPLTKDVETEVPIEIKKRKAEPPVAKPLTKAAESSEDETIMDIVPRKTVYKPLSNITNVSFIRFPYSVLLLCIFIAVPSYAQNNWSFESVFFAPI